MTDPDPTASGLGNVIAAGHVALRVERSKTRHADLRILGPALDAGRQEIAQLLQRKPMPEPQQPTYPTPDQIITNAPPVPEHWTMAQALGAASMPRMIEATFAYAPIPKAYTCRTIRNSTYYKPGDWVSLDTMTKICANPGWDTTMVEFHIEIPHLPIPLPLPIP